VQLNGSQRSRLKHFEEVESGVVVDKARKENA